MDSTTQLRFTFLLNWFARALARVPSWPCGRNKKPHIILQAETRLLSNVFLIVSTSVLKNLTENNKHVEIRIEDHLFNINIIWKSITESAGRCRKVNMGKFDSLLAWKGKRQCVRLNGKTWFQISMQSVSFGCKHWFTELIQLYHLQNIHWLSFQTKLNCTFCRTINQTNKTSRII